MSAIITVTDDRGSEYTFDLGPVISPRTVGIEAAWEHGCDIYAKMVYLLPTVQNRHNRIKADLYQKFKRLPVSKDASVDQYNPGTDKYFNEVWMNIQPEYQRSREERDRLQGAIDALKMTYLPGIRDMRANTNSGEHMVASQMTGEHFGRPIMQPPGEAVATPVPIPPPPLAVVETR